MSVLDESIDRIVPFSVPLSVPFRNVTHREGLLLHGFSGWSEFAPFIEYDDRTAAHWLRAALEFATQPMPEPHRTAIDVNAIIPAVDPETAKQLVRKAVTRDGCTTFKVKVAQAGQNLNDDEERLAAVLAACREAGVSHPWIRVDANAAWSVADALAALPVLDAAAEGLEYIEQPCQTLEELAEVRGQSWVPIAADESIRTADDPIRAAQADAADILVLKVAPLGGINNALAIAHSAGLPVVVSGAMDTAIGLSSGLAFAAALPSLPFACGLGTGALLADDLVATPLRPEHGQLLADRAIPDDAALERATNRMDSDRQRWWHDRLERCSALLELS